MNFLHHCFFLQILSSFLELILYFKHLLNDILVVEELNFDIKFSPI